MRVVQLEMRKKKKKKSNFAVILKRSKVQKNEYAFFIHVPLLRFAQSRNVTGLVSLPLLPLSNASKVDNLLLSAVPSLNYVASAFPEKKLFLLLREFSTYMGTLQKWMDP